MATEITARLYFREPPSPARLFGRMVETVAEWPQCGGGWQGLRAAGAGGDALRDADDRMRTDALVAAAAGIDGSALELATRTSFRCWRFEGTRVLAGQVQASVAAWADERVRARGEDLRVFG